MQPSNHKKPNGFTLIELIIIVAIIGILAVLILISVQGFQKKARDGKRESDLISIRTALVDYYDDNGSYPSPTTGSGGYHHSEVPNFLQELVDASYFSVTPRDPINGQRDGINYRYSYRQINSSQGFVLDAVMEKEGICGPRIYQRGTGERERIYVVYSDKEDFDGCTEPPPATGCGGRWLRAEPVPCT